MKKLLKSLVTIAVIGTMAFCIAGCKPYASLDDYIQSDIIQSEVESINEENGDEATMIIKAEGDTLVYEYTLKETIEEEDLEYYHDTFESYLEGTESTFVDIANSLDDVTNVKEPAVAVRYLNSDGSVIYETEYAATE